MIDVLMMRMVSLLCFFTFCILYALILLLFLQHTFLLAFAFSTLPLMTRVQRFNAHKDYLVCIIGFTTSGHYDLGSDSESKVYLITITFIFSSFAFVSYLLDCISTLMLMTAIMIVIC